MSTFLNHNKNRHPPSSHLLRKTPTNRGVLNRRLPSNAAPNVGGRPSASGRTSGVGAVGRGNEVINDGGGQVQLQRQQQPKQQGVKEVLKEGQIDMDEGEKFVA
jgi:hypothetical protein